MSCSCETGPLYDLTDQTDFLVKALEDDRLLNTIPIEDAISEGIIAARKKVFELAKSFVTKITKGPEEGFTTPDEIFRNVFKKGITLAIHTGFERGKSDVKDTSLSYIDEAIERYSDDRIDIEANLLSSYTTGIVRKAISDGLYQLETRAQLTKRVQDALESISPSMANNVARTLASLFANEGRLSAYSQAGVEKVEFVAVPTHCPICDEFAGKIYTLEQAHGKIPVHNRCRCSWLAIFPERR